MFVRFFSVGGKMEWDSIRDENDLCSRHMDIGRTQEERDEIIHALKKGGTLTKPGGFLKLAYEVFVRVA